MKLKEADDEMIVHFAKEKMVFAEDKSMSAMRVEVLHILDCTSIEELRQVYAIDNNVTVVEVTKAL